MVTLYYSSLHSPKWNLKSRHPFNCKVADEVFQSPKAGTTATKAAGAGGGRRRTTAAAAGGIRALDGADPKQVCGCAWPHDAYVEVEFGYWYQPNLIKWKQFRFKLTCAYVSNVPKLGEKFIPATLIKTNGPQLSFRRSPLRRGRRDRARGPRNKPCCLSEVREKKREYFYRSSRGIRR